MAPTTSTKLTRKEKVQAKKAPKAAKPAKKEVLGKSIPKQVVLSKDNDLFYDKEGARLNSYYVSRVSKKPFRALLSRNEKSKKGQSSKGSAGTLGAKVDHRHDLKWPKYIRLQRQKKIMQLRLRVPPAINHFRFSVKNENRHKLMTLAKRYRPETDSEKKRRISAIAKKIASGELKTAPALPAKLTFGINEVTKKIERKEAKLVVIANNVEPMELVVWLPALCRKMDVPYVIINGVHRLGKAVGLSNCSALCWTEIRAADEVRFERMVKFFRKINGFQAEAATKTWGGGHKGNLHKIQSVTGTRPHVTVKYLVSDSRAKKLEARKEKTKTRIANAKKATKDKKPQPKKD